MNFKAIILVFLSLFGIIEQGFSQSIDSHLKEFITTKDGLPSNEVYHIIQDKNNYLWFATDNGIVKYDGNSFKVFNSNDGLPNNTVFRFYEQPDGKIYGECLYNEYFYIENDSIHSYPYNSLISECIPKTSKCYSFHIDSLSTTHIGTMHGGITIDKNGNLIHLDRVLDDVKYNSVLKLKPFDNYVLTYLTSVLDSLDDNFSIRKLTKKGSVNYPVKRSNLSIANESPYAVKVDDEKIATMFGQKIFLLDSTKILSQIKPKSIPIGVFMIDSLLWVCTRNNGATAYTVTQDTLIEVDHFLDGNSVTSIIKDNENGYWFSTLESGIIHVYDFDLVRLFKAKTNQNISAFCIDQKNSLIGFDDGLLLNLKDTLSRLKLKTQIKAIKKWSNNHFFLYSAYEAINYKTYQTREATTTLSFDPSRYSDLINLSDSIILMRTSLSFKIYNKNSKSIVYSSDNKHQVNEKILSIGIYQNTILLATTKGLALFKKTDYSYIKNISLPSSVVALSTTNNDLIIACRNGNIYTYNGIDIIELNLQKEKIISRIFDLKTVNQIMIVATNLGIEKYIYDQIKDTWSFYEFINLPGVINIHLSEEDIYYVTKKEIYLDRNNIQNNLIPTVEIVEFRVNGNISSLSQNIQLTHNQNNLQFKINSISYSSALGKFKYKIEGINQDYLFTSDPNINYASLPSGDYKFIVSSTTNGIDYSNKIEYEFTVLPPYWKSTWFIITTTLLILIILIFLYYRQVQKIKIKSALQESIAKLKSQALTAQLNPHLVFNILNSIQGLISEEETEQANSYLSKFSKFMRNSLNASKKGTVSLAEEVKITESYIELEMLRFPKNVSITLTNNVAKSDYLLPPLIIQPFIENAIKHGIMPSEKENGIINIIINELNGYLLICIEDNGNGFKHPINFNSGDGMRISKERLEILNKNNQVYLEQDNSVTRIILKVYYEA